MNQAQKIAAGLCGWCGQERGEGGTKSRCRSCADKVKEQVKASRRTLQEAGCCITCEKPRGEDGDRWRCRRCINKRQVYNRAKTRVSHLKRKFGITALQYGEMLRRQQYRCAVCRRPRTGLRLAVDHCHATGKVRGLLCIPCNAGLGNFQDTPELLWRALLYLQKHLPVDKHVFKEFNQPRSRPAEDNHAERN